MRFLSLMLLALLAACQSADSADSVGSFAWMERVDRQLSISDGQGHGPDYGSQEWCDVVYFRLHGQHTAEPAPCDQKWMQEVDQAIQKR